MSSEPNLNSPPHATQADVLYQELCRLRGVMRALLERIDRCPDDMPVCLLGGMPEYAALKREVENP